jgi:hypothetical protein
MAKGFTLDTRRCLYGEPRLSDPQVRVLRELTQGTTTVKANGTLFSLKGHYLVAIRGSISARQIRAELTQRGRKILAAIDAENAFPTNTSEL